VDDNCQVVEKLGLEYRILSDSDREVIEAYGLIHPGASIDGGDIARPATLIVDGAGAVRWRNLTENWRVRVRPDAVIEALAGLDAD
jgi:peroxiredoxin